MTDKTQKHLDDLKEIRSMMEKSSRFISLSGLSGVIAGLIALTGAGAGIWKLQNSSRYLNALGVFDKELITFFFMDAFIVLTLSVSISAMLTIKQAKKNGQNIWDNTSKRLLINMLIPLTAGGIFCLVLLQYGIIGLIAPAILLFYGIALINASKYTLNDIRYLGLCQIMLGLIATQFIGYGLYFWAIGFGTLHIIYGIVMYLKYER